MTQNTWKTLPSCNSYEVNPQGDVRQRPKTRHAPHAEDSTALHRKMPPGKKRKFNAHGRIVLRHPINRTELRYTRQQLIDEAWPSV